MDFPSGFLFYKVDQDQNQRRFYRLRLMRNLFGEVDVLREFGRIGHPGRVMVDHYAALEEAEVDLCRLARQKLRKGYRRIFAGSPYAPATAEAFRGRSECQAILEDPLTGALLTDHAATAPERIRALFGSVNQPSKSRFLPSEAALDRYRRAPGFAAPERGSPPETHSSPAASE